jgi:hypothetical protein
MIVDQIDVEGVAVLEPEYDPPVCPHRYGPEASQIPSQGMKAKAWQGDILDRARRIQQAENVLDPVDELRIDPLPFAILEQAFEALVTKAINQ